MEKGPKEQRAERCGGPGLRSWYGYLVTFGALLAISLFILRAHLRFAAGPTDGVPGGEPPPPSPDD